MSKMIKPFFIKIIFLFIASIPLTFADSESVTIGSKGFTESVILGEIIDLIALSEGIPSDHKSELGGTRVLWSALLKSDIDIYPEYTGTLTNEIFSRQNITDKRQLQAALKQHGIIMSAPLGFNNTYILGMQATQADQLNITTISDLQQHPQLVFGFNNEFMDRQDGWPGLKRHYHLPQKNVRGLNHDLAYRGLQSGSLDLIDLYATDAEIKYYQIHTLKDDKQYFPTYQAVFIYREDLVSRFPEMISSLGKLAGLIDETTMSGLNAKVKLNGETETHTANVFLDSALNLKLSIEKPSAMSVFWKHTYEHLTLVFISLSAAIVFAVPLGVYAARRPKAGQVILTIAGIIQTIPSLALFVFMIPLLGIGGPPAIVALFLYSLLPIIRNTYSGLHDVATPIRESAIALGLPEKARLRYVELPMATRSILSGIKTSSVINVGTATLAALIGAGGYGQPILTGIRLDDTGLILQGAIPAAVLALLVQGFFGFIERRLLPKGLHYTQ